MEIKDEAWTLPLVQLDGQDMKTGAGRTAKFMNKGIAVYSIWADESTGAKGWQESPGEFLVQLFSDCDHVSDYFRG